MDDQDPQAVEGVIQEGRPEEHLADPPDRAGVDRQDVVVRLRVAAHQVDVDDVEDDECPDGDAADAMEGPGEHPLAASVSEQHCASG
jgi:hypothetical protein